jgi:hypothetical protein
MTPDTIKDPVTTAPAGKGKGKFQLKRVIVWSTIAAVIIAMVIVVKAINFGKLTVDIIERNAHIAITYEGMQGNILRGFRISGYEVKISESDSAYGSYAEINYRLSFRRLGLPTLFEINLLEPTVHITQKKQEPGGAGGGFRYPNLYLGLRINVKNGTVVYDNGSSFITEKISGLVFIDFVGSKIYVSTMNLSFASRNYPLSVTSLNAAATLSSRDIAIRTLRLKGKGLLIEGQADLDLVNRRFGGTIRKMEVDLEKFDLYKGTVSCQGAIAYANGRFQPELRGDCVGFYPADRFKFETGTLGDTIIINAFDGEMLQGSFFAQVRFLDLKHWDMETNFRDLNAALLLKRREPLLINGFVGYQDSKFHGFINSTSDSGIAIDSLFMFGYRSGTAVYLDSLYVREGKERLRLSGLVWPRCSLLVKLDDFTVDRWNRYFALKGSLSGQAAVWGDWKETRRMTFSADIAGRQLSLFDIACNDLALNVTRFTYGDTIPLLKIRATAISYGNVALDTLRFRVERNRFLIRGRTTSDSLVIAGELEKDLQGTVTRLDLWFRGLFMASTEPITFDGLKKKIGAFSFAICGGTFSGSIAPTELRLSGIDLADMGRALNIKALTAGELNAALQTDTVLLSGRAVDFLGLHNGSIALKGALKNNSIAVESLSVVDDNGQRVSGRGLVSLAASDFSVQCENLRTWIFPFLKSSMQNPDGVLNGTVRFTGTFDDFALTGSGVVTDGRFGIKIIGDEFDSVQSKIRFEGRTIYFESMKGNVYASSDIKRSYSAPVTGSGFVKLEPRFRIKNLNFDFSFRNAPGNYAPYAYGKGTGNFSIGIRDLIPYYNGNINVSEGIVPVEFGMQIVEDVGKKPDDYRMNIKISGDRNIWLRNRDADIEFGGEIYIIKEHGPLYITGTLETKRGTYYWLNHDLTITEGNVIFVPEAEMIDPELDIWAEMNTHERSTESNEEIKIKLHFFGPISSPIFEFFTEPEGIFTEQDIVTYLNLNITWRELESMQQGSYMSDVLPRSLLAWLESDVSRRIRAYTGLDYFRIDAPLFQADEKTKLTVGKYISRNLFITYTYDITDFANEFNVEYFIDDRNEILIRRDDTGEYGMEYQYRIRF